MVKRKRGENRNLSDMQDRSIIEGPEAVISSLPVASVCFHWQSFGRQTMSWSKLANFNDLL